MKLLKGFNKKKKKQGGTLSVHVILYKLTVGPAISEVPESTIAEQPPEQNPDPNRTKKSQEA